MIEIKPSDLQPNQTYYIDMTTYRLKAIFNKIVPKNGHNPEYAVFYKYTDVNSSKMDYFTGPCTFMSYHHYKYYLPTRDAIIKEREKYMVNSILQQITGEPCFKYYL
jgi:hypothetical protein